MVQRELFDAHNPYPATVFHDRYPVRRFSLVTPLLTIPYHGTRNYHSFTADFIDLGNEMKWVVREMRLICVNRVRSEFIAVIPCYFVMVHSIYSMNDQLDFWKWQSVLFVLSIHRITPYLFSMDTEQHYGCHSCLLFL